MCFLSIVITDFICPLAADWGLRLYRYSETLLLFFLIQYSSFEIGLIGSMTVLQFIELFTIYYQYTIHLQAGSINCSITCSRTRVTYGANYVFGQLNGGSICLFIIIYLRGRSYQGKVWRDITKQVSTNIQGSRTWLF